MSLDYTDRESSAIKANEYKSTKISILDVINTVTKYYSDNDIENKITFQHGLNKASVEFDIVEYITSQLMLIEKSLQDDNDDKSVLIKSYFSSIYKLIELLKVFDFNVAEKRILSHNIGYTLSSIKRQQN